MAKSIVAVASRWLHDLTRRGIENPIFRADSDVVNPAMAEAFLKWGGPKSMTRFSSPTTRAGSGVARNFKRGEHNFHILF